MKLSVICGVAAISILVNGKFTLSCPAHSLLKIRWLVVHWAGSLKSLAVSSQRGHSIFYPTPPYGWFFIHEFLETPRIWQFNWPPGKGIFYWPPGMRTFIAPQERERFYWPPGNLTFYWPPGKFSIKGKNSMFNFWVTVRFSPVLMSLSNLLIPVVQLQY